MDTFSYFHAHAHLETGACFFVFIIPIFWFHSVKLSYINQEVKVELRNKKMKRSAEDELSATETEANINQGISRRRLVKAKP
jgi:hypothetical protein